MHDIKIIRKNPDSFKKKISERGTDIDVNKLLELDKKSVVQENFNLYQ